MQQVNVLTGCAVWVACGLLVVGSAGAADPPRTRAHELADALRAALREEKPDARVRGLDAVRTELDRLVKAKEQYKSLMRRKPTDADRLRVEETLRDLGALPGLVQEPILKACADPLADVRLAAVMAADPDRFDSSAGLPVFRRLLADPDDRVQTRAIYRLGQLRENAREAVPDIVRLLRESKDTEQRKIAIRALGEMRSAAKEATPALADFLAPANPIGIRHTAVVALACIGASHQPAAQLLIDTLRERPGELTERLAGALYRCDANAVPAAKDLQALFRDPPSHVKPTERVRFRMSVLAPFQAIGRHDDGASFDFLLGIAGDLKEERDVRREAVRILGECGPKAAKALPGVIGMVRKVLDPKTREDYRGLDLENAVVPLGAAAVPSLIDLVNQGPNEVRLWAVDMLATIGPPASQPAAPHVEKWLGKGDFNTRDKIARQYPRIAGKQ